MPQALDRRSHLRFFPACFGGIGTRFVEGGAGQSTIDKRSEIALCLLSLRLRLGEVDAELADSVGEHRELRLHRQRPARQLGFRRAGASGRSLRFAQLQPCQPVGFGCLLASGARQPGSLHRHPLFTFERCDRFGQYRATVLVPHMQGGGGRA